MPEIKHTFTGGKMNKDLDERFVRPGEYRDAMNIQVRATDGDAAGTVQNLRGNTSIGSSYYSDWMDDESEYPVCVASVANEKSNITSTKKVRKTTGYGGTRAFIKDPDTHSDDIGLFPPIHHLGPGIVELEPF